MHVLIAGQSGEIRQTLDAKLRLHVECELHTVGLDRRSLGRVDDLADVDLIVVALEQCSGEEMESVDRILATASVSRQVPVVILCGKPTGNQVLHWLKDGSSAVELWPCHSSRIGFLLDYLTVGRQKHAVQHRRIDAAERQHPGVPNGIITASRTMRQLVQHAQRVAPLDVNVLLSGETGVGKTRLAQFLHQGSKRSSGKFIAVNCGALPETLLESELFGHRKGAFTGADSDRKGRFEDVGDGTLFLDEVDSIPISSQCKLLRAIENRVFEPLGCNQSIPFRGRLLAASNSHLETLIAEGQFRADLYYRLGVVELAIPPLRERTEDIQPIVDETLRGYAARNDLPVTSISNDVLDLFHRYDWPGNIRQLKNIIESSASFCSGTQIEVSDLPQSLKSHFYDRPTSHSLSRSPQTSSQNPATDATLAESRATVEVNRIRNALVAVDNNRTQAAKRLGISRTMLYKKLAKYGLINAV